MALALLMMHIGGPMSIVEDHGPSHSTIVDMDGPPAPATHATSTSSNRLIHRDQADGEVGCTAVEMVTPGSSTHSPVGGRRPVPRHDRQRATDSTPDALKDGQERRSWPPEFAGAPIDELSSGEVW